MVHKSKRKICMLFKIFTRGKPRFARSCLIPEWQNYSAIIIFCQFLYLINLSGTSLSSNWFNVVFTLSSQLRLYFARSKPQLLNGLSRRQTPFLTKVAALLRAGRRGKSVKVREKTEKFRQCCSRLRRAKTFAVRKKEKERKIFLSVVYFSSHNETNLTCQFCYDVNETTSRKKETIRVEGKIITLFFVFVDML